MTLRVEDLTVTRGGLPILEGIGFSVERGTALVLRGPNGAGKTSLLRTLAGLQPAGGGRVEPGVDAMAYAAHADGLKTMLSVEENLAFWAEIFGAAGIGPAVDAFGLASLRARPAGRLSAGQKRRLGLARLMLTGRPVWLLDEPTVSLDADGVAALQAALGAHLGSGGMAVLATHIDLGIDAPVLDVGVFKARPVSGAFDEAFG